MTAKTATRRTVDSGEPGQEDVTVNRNDTHFSSDCQDKITFTVLDKKAGEATKKIYKDAGGSIVKDSSECSISDAVGEKIEIRFQDFPNLLTRLKKNQVIVHGVPKDKNLPSSFKIISQKKFNSLINKVGTIPRSLDFFEYPPTSNVLAMIDYDPLPGVAPTQPDALLKIIADILPGFEIAACVVTHSTSSCINDENGLEVTGTGAGYHIYFMLTPGTDVKRFVEIFKTRSWIAGYGYIMISKSGAMLVRNILFDEFVFSPERLDFVAGAVIPDGWTQTRPEPVYKTGTVFDPATLPDLTDAETRQCKALVDDAKQKVSGEASNIRDQFIDSKAADLHLKKPELSLNSCKSTIRNACSNDDLYGDFEIFLKNGVVVSVHDILSNPETYDLEICSDPIEPEGTAGKAQIYINQDQGNGKPVIHSFNHGSHYFFLHKDRAFDDEQVLTDVLAWVEETEDNRTILKNWLEKTSHLSPHDIEIVKQAVHDKTGVKISILNNELKEKRTTEKKAESKARAEKTSIEREKMGIREIVYWPTETGKCCHQISHALRDHPEEKIYRFAGNLIKIVNKQPTTVRMVKKIHDKGGAYPPMPIISQFTNETLCHEVEKVAVCQTKDKEGNSVDIPWPKNVLKGVQELTETHEKPLVGIVEHPYIGDDFKPVLTRGYDSTTGLYKVSDVNPDIDFFKDPGEALIYIADEVLQDFPFSSEMDEIAAVSCFLTGMQRKLITDNSGCPGYLFTAPVQSSGKTTLCQAINQSLYGRPAAATSFSKDDTEMAKHLLGILQEGISCVLFDNLPEGSVIESNELAKAITSDSYSNRWLGHNKTLTAPSSVLWLMTGNNISICGDFNTRFLKIELDPKAANPDQRRFKRENITDWCDLNRGKILGACMKIILAGKDYSNPDLKPSRFPSWDRFVRNPLFKISEIDIAEIFQRNKMSDPKIEGQNNFFEAWFNAFGSAPTTAKQVLDYCTRATDDERFSGVGVDNELAEATRDIFSGGRLPSTNSLGKWLGTMKNRYFGGYKLIDSGIGTNREQLNKITWVVKDV